MKKLIPLIPFVLLFALSNCTETIYEEIFKTDTVYLQRPPIVQFSETVRVDTVEKTLVRVDTVEVTVVVHETDTVVQIKTDSIFIEKIVEKIIHHYDTVVKTLVNTVYVDKIITIHDTVKTTVYEQRVIYQSIEFVFPGRSTFYVADEFKGYYDDYNKAASDRNVFLNGGNVVITRVNPDNLPAEGWVSNFYYVASDQAVIEISEQLPIEQCRAAIYREMTRWQLKKKYSNDISKILSPLFRTSPEPTVSEINILFQ